MAPAVDHDSTNRWSHKPPTVSNGDAYMLDDLNQTDPPNPSKIYCLTFDDVCARKGKSSLNPDHYQNIQMVPAIIPTGQKRWTSQNNRQAPTLILPLPDSYSSDTTWPMRFADKFDETGESARAK